MRKCEDLSGRTYGRLLVLRRAHNDKSHNTMWLCRCECGTEKINQAGCLKSAAVISCGCAKRNQWQTHGLSKHPEYHCWIGMIKRCYNINEPAYPRYGGRGIIVCDRWRKSPKAFFDDMGPRPTGYEIDRVDNNGPYAPENCRWASFLQQANNRRSNFVISHNGESLTLMEWSRRTGVKRTTIRARIARGLPPEQALRC